jgi:hypothetical protein
VREACVSGETRRVTRKERTVKKSPEWGHSKLGSEGAGEAKPKERPNLAKELGKAAIKGANR